MSGTPGEQQHSGRERGTHVSLLLVAERDRWPAIVAEAQAGYHVADCWVPEEFAKPLSIGQVRELQRFATHAAYGSGKLAIIPAADTLRHEAANALLKLIEEPPMGMQVLLLSETVRVLPTIASRVQVVRDHLRVSASREDAPWATVLSQLPTATANERQAVSELLYLASLRHSTVRTETVLAGYP